LSAAGAVRDRGYGVRISSNAASAVRQFKLYNVTMLSVVLPRSGGIVLSRVDFFKTFAFTASRRLGFDVRRVRKSPDLVEFLAHRQVGIVYDVGANAGQFGSWLRRRGYRGRIVSFEPVKAAFDRLKAAAELDGAWAAHRLALGAAAGSASINLSRNTQFSSFKRIRDDNPDPDSEIVDSEEVPVETLDSMTLGGPSATFLKIDTQGFEREVLDGAAQLLKSTTGVLLELPIIHLYESSWTMPAALEYMRERGFVLCQVEQNNHHPDDPMATFEFDCVFRRVSDADGA
jgi:FkbM family methyltransferase